MNTNSNQTLTIERDDEGCSVRIAIESVAGSAPVRVTFVKRNATIEVMDDRGQWIAPRFTAEDDAFTDRCIDTVLDEADAAEWFGDRQAAEFVASTFR